MNSTLEAEIEKLLVKKLRSCGHGGNSGVPRGGLEDSTPPPPRKSEVLTKLSRISFSSSLCSHTVVIY
jgi:hypothetical protein